ncbi:MULTISPECIES: proline iminopeptidase-family hydrolase [unclassified Flavobacterium]|uniref:proline iminopeptidase-family hydrolase n=1 Tax=unclassified Flavobacterium TaxID=196869 RepID=UPI0012915787|nr:MULTISPECIES: proline iminopeptidase-family hydrolase [unclassified Flavobacterium]MQP52831.1 proline iminopeptidase-family hydrolase [Flavobacterium sp. LMO9]MQP63105.1 proline iminopeptidase-family hydrolase [Flavobacterium sp. LMO6]
MKNLFRTTLLLFSIALFTSCKQETVATQNEYFAQSSDSIQNGGVKVIPISTPKGTFNVWTKRIGNNPKIKVLLLNGGPGATHEYFECFENFLPAEGIEFIYYDQLGCGNADNPNDISMWDLARYVEEVEQVRIALNLNKDNFYLLGHSWGGILAMEYSLKYQNNMKGLIISNMMSSCPEYGKYADDVLAKQMNPEVLAEIMKIEADKDFSNPRYMELLLPNFYEKHILRFSAKDWPEPVNRSFAKMNQSLYVTMQGPSEFGISGKLENWDRTNELKNITIPSLVIGATHDTMDPKFMEKMSTLLPKGSFLLCSKGSHMAFYDDQKTYFEGLISFLKK